MKQAEKISLLKAIIKNEIAYLNRRIDNKNIKFKYFYEDYRHIQGLFQALEIFSEKEIDLESEINLLYEKAHKNLEY